MPHICQTTLAATLIATLAFSPASHAAESSDSALDDIPYGIEALAQYRSEYSYRGFILAQDTIDLQLSAQFAFNKTTYLNTAAWFGSEAGDGNFSEAGFLLDLRKDVGDFTFSLSSTFRSYSDSLFESGTNLQAALIYQISDEIDLTTQLAYDTGANGWYGDIATNYYLRISDKSFANLTAGTSFVSNYYRRDGINDFFARASYTYNINQSLAITPYLGTSILLDSNDLGSDSLHGGMYFSVSF